MSKNIFLSEMGKRIASRRKELKLTQEQVAEQMNLSLQSISCIELGKKEIKLSNLINLCRVLHTSTDYILTGERSKEELSGIWKKLSALKDDDYEVVENLIEHLNKKE